MYLHSCSERVEFETLQRECSSTNSNSELSTAAVSLHSLCSQGSHKTLFQWAHPFVLLSISTTKVSLFCNFKQVIVFISQFDVEEMY